MNRAERKQRLIAEGERYRAHALLAKERMRARVQGGVLAAGGLSRLAATAAAAYAGSGVAAGIAGKLPVLLPVLRVLAGLAGRKGAGKVVLRTVVAGAAAAAALIFLKRKRG